MKGKRRKENICGIPTAGESMKDKRRKEIKGIVCNVRGA
jgi:hypothetical protein